MKSVRVLSAKGFSLVELMIVVAIIGILSAIAVPNFVRYQQKARQAEAKNNLAAYYSAQKASFAEYQGYPGNFVAIGFRPEGELKYRLTTAHNAGVPGNVTPTMATCITTDMSVTCEGTTAGSFQRTWTEHTHASSATTATGCTIESDNDSFRGCAASMLGGGTVADVWSIDQAKVLTNTSPGIQ